MATQSHRAGFVALIGRPNVGKSTLMNALLQQKVAAVSPRPQTTRRRQFGILTLPQAQLVLVDTPGLHQAHHKLGDYMNEVAVDALADADVILWIIDTTEALTAEDKAIATRLSGLSRPGPILAVLNKTDLVTEAELKTRQNAVAALLPQAQLHPVAATRPNSLPGLLATVIELLPESPPFYDAEQVTDLYEREIAADLIREAVLLHLRDEVPHAVAVRIDEYKERSETLAYIAATLFVERDSQKSILIGQNGSMIKKIGASARQEIEAMSGRQVYLDLHIKVSKNWRDDPNALARFGYQRVDEA
ncbi:MAG TPA: GTPase Era [Anaerolineaceae bacterium]|jgi:GTP-binding protein Era|nr:GTPase Era [Anaerolineaceae bacterium]